MRIATHEDNKNLAEKYQKYFDDIKKNLNEHAWDGEWYVRYFDNNKNIKE